MTQNKNALLEPIPESFVMSRVELVSEKLKNSAYGETVLSRFATGQPNLVRFLSSHANDFGGAEQVIDAVFHCDFVSECIAEHYGRTIPPISFDDLDAFHTKQATHEFDSHQPALASYLASNLTNPKVVEVVALIGLVFCRKIDRG